MFIEHNVWNPRDPLNVRWAPPGSAGWQQLFKFGLVEVGGIQTIPAVSPPSGIRRHMACCLAIPSGMSDARLVISARPVPSSGRSDPRVVPGRALCLGVPGVETGHAKDISRSFAPHWSKVQYLFSFSSHRVHIIWKQFPMSGMWAIGILLGIKLCFVGLIMLMDCSPVRSVAPTVSQGLTCLLYGYSIPIHEGFPHQTCKGCR